MGDFYFLANWDKDKQSTWSGTCFGLFSALQKRLAVTDCNISDNGLPVLFHKILRRLGLEAHDFDMRLMERQRRKARRMVGAAQSVVFQFGEILFDTGKRRTFVYQDMSADSVRHLYETSPEVFSVSGFQFLENDAMQRRADFQNKYYQSCSGIFTMGRWFAEDLVGRLGVPEAKVHHVGGGINLDKSLIDYSAKRGNKILFVGRDFVRKGGGITLKAFQILRERCKDVELYIAGPSTSPLESGMEGVRYFGDCSHEKLARLFNECDIFVMPSYFEAYGLVFIEALTYGLPCIGRNVNEMPYFIENGETGLLLGEDDAESLALMMEKLLHDEAIKANVRAKRDWYVNEYSWDTVAGRIVDAIYNGTVL